jgi:rhodanese-related sulfurtransferase
MSPHAKSQFLTAGFGNAVILCADIVLVFPQIHSSRLIMNQNCVSHGRIVIPVVAFVLLTAACFAADTPTSLAGGTVVDAARAKVLMDSGAVLVDARVANEYAEAHIKGAVSIPYKEKSAKTVNYNAAEDSFDLSRLPGDKNAQLVFSCNGAECWKSYKAATAALKAGYKHVYWLREGLPGWKAKGYAVE